MQYTLLFKETELIGCEQQLILNYKRYLLHIINILRRITYIEKWLPASVLQSREMQHCRGSDRGNVMVTVMRGITVCIYYE